MWLNFVSNLSSHRRTFGPSFGFVHRRRSDISCFPIYWPCISSLFVISWRITIRFQRGFRAQRYRVTVTRGKCGTSGDHAMSDATLAVTVPFRRHLPSISFPAARAPRLRGRSRVHEMHVHASRTRADARQDTRYDDVSCTVGSRLLHYAPIK